MENTQEELITKATVLQVEACRLRTAANIAGREYDKAVAEFVGVELYRKHQDACDEAYAAEQEASKAWYEVRRAMLPVQG